MDLDAILEDSCTRDWQTVESAETNSIRFAVIGLGWFTKGRALPALEQSSLCDPTVLVSSSKAKAEKIAADFDSVQLGISYDQFHNGVGRDVYDAVYIVTPNALHLDYVKSAAEFGKDVLCEKPMERDSDRASAMSETCAEADVKLMIAYRMHTEPAVRRAREIIEAGYVGDPMEVRGDMSQRLLERVNSDPDQWRLDKGLAGGGALFDIGIYPLNTARFLLGADPIAVTGQTASTHDAFDEVDETVNFSLEFPDNVFGSCYASHNARQSSGVTVTGTEGQVRIEPAFFQDQARQLHVSRGDGRASVTLTKVDQMLEEFDYFADRVHTDGQIKPDAEHGIIDMHVMEAIYEAADERRWVDIDI